MKKEIYLFSGLGADERVFQHLDLSNFSATFIKWITPEQGETIENYASRLLKQITSPKPVLIGLSFGGLVATEVAKQIDTTKVILIASAKTAKEIPFYYRMIGFLNLHRLLPTKLLKASNFITNWFFGATLPSDQQLLKQILIDTDPTFLKWAIEKVVKWKNKTLISNVFHIHGTCDKVLPFYFVKCNSVIKNGGHLMTLNKPDEITTILKREI